MSQIADLVEHAARAAAAAAPALGGVPEAQIEEALARIAARLESESRPVLSANAADVEGAVGVLSSGLTDRLRLDERRLASIAGQVRSLTSLPALERVVDRRTLANGLVVEERRVPVGVVGAVYEARPNVTVDLSTQLLKSRNAGVLRTGRASLRTAEALVDSVIAPALAEAGLKPEVVQLVRAAEHEGAEAMVSFPRLIPLVIIRGSGETTARLARLAAERGVRTLQHAEGGGVLYVHPSADASQALSLVEAGLDRLGVCNRLNWLLVDAAIWEAFLPQALDLLGRLGIAASLPPHDHPFSKEWATDADRDATVTVAPVNGLDEAVSAAHEHTSGLAAAIACEDERAASAFLGAYRGTGAFVNATTRFLDGFEISGAPETGISVDHAPGPRGPVTYRDLYLRQYAVIGDGSQRR